MSDIEVTDSQTEEAEETTEQSAAVTPASSSSVEPSEGYGGLPDDLDTGLEDFGQEDMVMPRLNIAHRDAEFEDNLTGQTYKEMRVVLLGLVKQRILWAENVEDGEGPLCKSYDAKEGLPTENFPWKASGFEKQDGENIHLPCEQCNLKEWGTHPGRKVPWCSEQFVFPLLMEVPDEGWIAPAILTFQRAGVKAVRQYLSAFKRSNQPLFTVVTKMSLTPNKKGNVEYATPKFQQQDGTPRELWEGFAGHYRQIRDFLRTEPITADVSSSDDDNVSEAGKDDDLPF